MESTQKTQINSIEDDLFSEIELGASPVELSDFDVAHYETIDEFNDEMLLNMPPIEENVLEDSDEEIACAEPIVTLSDVEYTPSDDLIELQPVQEPPFEAIRCIFGRADQKANQDDDIITISSTDSRLEDDVESDDQEILIRGESMFEPEYVARRKRKSGTPVQKLNELAPKRLKFDDAKLEENDADNEESLENWQDEIQPLTVEAQTQTEFEDVLNQHVYRMPMDRLAGQENPKIFLFETQMCQLCDAPAILTGNCARCGRLQVCAAHQFRRVPAAIDQDSCPKCCSKLMIKTRWHTIYRYSHYFDE